VMNQMMGAASTALSDFLGRLVNISTPRSLELDDVEAFKKSQFKDDEEQVVVVRFSLSIENALESEFMNIMPIALARELVSGFGLGDEDEAPAVNPLTIPAPAADSGGVMSQADIERMMASMGGETPPPAPEPSGGVMSQADIERMMASMGGSAAPPSAPAAPTGAPGAYPPPSYGAGYPGYPPGYMPVPPGYPYLPPDPKVIATQAVAMPQLDPASKLSSEQAENLDLIMTVPLEVTVEIGRTRRKVQDILSFSKGSLVVLDKLAGDQVDLFVNGKCIARGDVVVIDDNFGIRITEILQKPGLEGLTQGK
ncbi:MAG: flagellar motor switch protein FliN, partial [Oscillospiraceae bacterium]